MATKRPPVWFAEPVVAVDPCALQPDCTGQGSDFPARNELWDADSSVLQLTGAANEVLGFQLYFEKKAGRPESIRLEGADDLKLSVAQHLAVPHEGRHYDDALVPVDGGELADASRSIARRAPRVKGRRRRGFFIEIQIPKGTEAGRRELSLVLKAGGEERRIKVVLKVYGFELPDSTSCVGDINNYGAAPATGFDGLDPGGDLERFLNIERAYFRMAREHRASFHLLPFSQSGRVEENYAPVLAGAGRTRRVVDWEPFDRHWGPYLDGSAFDGTRGGPQPIDHIYLPVNLNWPAFFEKFGTPGYDLEFKSVLREMAAHFREKGWTHTKFEAYFNHKVSWKYYPWDIDETFYQRDRFILTKMARLVNEVAAEFPEVKLVNRIDSSNIYAECARGEEGRQIQLWVVSRNLHSLDPEANDILRANGQEVWFYGGSSLLAAPDRLDSLRWPWMSWGRQTDGFCWWCGTLWGSWEEAAPGGSHCFYPGERFGIEGPLASLRLKVLHRGMQDHAYLQLLGERTGSRSAADACVAQALGCREREDWYQRKEGREVAHDEIQTHSSTEKPWNTAPRSAWIDARTALAEAIEKAH